MWGQCYRQDLEHPHALLTQRFGPGAEPSVVSVPGRVNLIGEHIDYHNLPVMPIAIQRRIRIAFRRRDDRRIRAASTGTYGEREFEWKAPLEPAASGDWVNYVKAAAQAVDGKWSVANGIDAVVDSDLPPAAGLSSSSALLTGFTLALLRANGVGASFEELMEVLPEGEYFVGTRGGGMDHAAVLASEAGCALLIRFGPLAIAPVLVPKEWSFLVAHSLTTAEKSGEMRARYNSRRTEGMRAVERLGFKSYREAVEGRRFDQLRVLADRGLEGKERRRFLHVTGEAFRVEEAAAALRAKDADAFGRLMNASHESMRDLLEISNAALDELVETALRAGAFGARLTGAGFGGCAVVACHAVDRDRVAEGIVRGYYSKRADFDRVTHLIAAEPSPGALR